jgi:hypothetical protein
MTNREPTLGDEVCHKVTGFKGIVTSHSKHLSGCDRLWVEPTVGDDGKLREGQWADIDMVDIVTPAVIAAVQYDRRAPGGIDLPPSR